MPSRPKAKAVATSLKEPVAGDPYGPNYQFSEQQKLAFRALMSRLGGILSFNILEYYNLFGEPGLGQHPFGPWAGYGLQVLLNNYRHRAFLQPHLGAPIMGWFLAPVPFSRLRAREPYSSDLCARTMWYPAVFSAVQSQWEMECVPMACLAILKNGSRVWHVHYSRMVIWPHDGQPIAYSNVDWIAEVTR